MLCCIFTKDGKIANPAKEPEATRCRAPATGAYKADGKNAYNTSCADHKDALGTMLGTGFTWGPLPKL